MISKIKTALKLLDNEESRRTILSDTMDELNKEILHSSSIYKLLETYKPDIIIDSINAATGIAYQDLYTTYRSIKRKISETPTAESMIIENREAIV